jgi:CBS domain-containing protein
MRLREIMTTPVVSVSPDEPARSAWARMELKGIRHMVVTEGRLLLGVLSDRDLGGIKGGALRKGRTVRDLMTLQVTTATPGTTLRQAANLMRGQLIGCLPVVDGDRLVGIVTATDVLNELGRGSSRPTVRAKRQDMRLPPASARAARNRKRAGKARQRGTARARKSATDGESAPDGRAATITGRMTPWLGRERARQPDSAERAPFADRIARPDKRELGRTAPPDVPAHIRSVDSMLDDADKDYLRRKLGRKLGKFALSIERASVRIEDVNGPRGGVDKRCRIKIVLIGLPSVVVEEQHHSLQAAMDSALARAEHAVRSAVQKRRITPLKPRAGKARKSMPSSGAPTIKGEGIIP